MRRRCATGRGHAGGADGAKAVTRVLVLNAGSSTLKASVLDVDPTLPLQPLDPVATSSEPWGSDATRADRTGGLASMLERLGRPVVEAVGHRVVHGGERFVAPVVVDDAVVGALDALSPLAPLHNPVAVETLRAARTVLVGVPHVAVFDTAYHATLREEQVRYPVPGAWRQEHGVRRFGFHGLSVEWATARSAAMLARPPVELALVVAHLGSGCSVTAVSGGRSVATSMGLTPLEGPMMGTRAGSIDPGILLHLLRRGVTVDDIAEALDHESGLLGVSGVSGDVREVRAAAAGGAADAALALAMFADRVAGWIALVATALERLDALVFTAGIGEHDGRMRAAIARRLAVLGFDEAAVRGVAADVADDAVLVGGTPAVLRIAAREDVVIARAAARVVAAG